ncbi:hypothetical protein BD779DRAFT_1481664 [Infundibulicybe gibba]|nr:hypothetical protein BD779DRAFT_1481664 [Infundibulicybe gibba]
MPRVHPTCEHQGHTWIRTSTDPWETWIREYNTRRCTGTHEFEAVRRREGGGGTRAGPKPLQPTREVEYVPHPVPTHLPSFARGCGGGGNGVDWTDWGWGAFIQAFPSFPLRMGSGGDGGGGIVVVRTRDNCWQCIGRDVGGFRERGGSIFEVSVTGTRWWQEHSKIRWKTINMSGQGGRDGDGWERRHESWNLPESAAPDFSFAREGDVGLQNELDASGGRMQSQDGSNADGGGLMVQWNENDSSWRNDVEWPLAVQDSGRQLRCSMDASATLWLAAVCRDDGGVDVRP